MHVLIITFGQSSRRRWVGTFDPSAAGQLLAFEFYHQTVIEKLKQKAPASRTRLTEGFGGQLKKTEGASAKITAKRWKSNYQCRMNVEITDRVCS